MHSCYSGVSFLFRNVLKRDWHNLKLINDKREQRLPTALSISVVWEILNKAQNKAQLTTVYACGLMLHELFHLHVSDIDSQRMRIYVHWEKALKPYVALPV